MTRSTPAIVAVALAFLLASPAFAQEDEEDETPTIGGKPAPAPPAPPAPTPMPTPEPAPKTEYTPPKAEPTPPPRIETPAARGEKRLSEVIKGFYVETNMGYVRALKTDIPALANGFVTGFLLGYDIIDIVSIEGGFMGAFVFADNPTGESIDPDSSAVSSDFAMRALEANVKFSYISTDRWFFYLRAGGGFSFNSPEETRKSDQTKVNIAGSAPVVAAAPGVEYYTNVRHFSVGLEPKVYILPTLGSYMLAVNPYLKFTF
jgi:hypothetical protein